MPVSGTDKLIISYFFSKVKESEHFNYLFTFY